jgi:heme/copper-type cytochrome/quinol oxidase subunit 1
MGLATVIRLEFAYPGVGVLAGDSLQYLSIATAHGVIMVFYMIMPAIFGAFGNFLLPTQLGVHDVAFPRLNSAAFWFLPGGVIMLFQLVCTDRRYARMNCFNIRELQGVLKRRFFTDLMSSHDYRTFFGRTIISLRFKLNSSDLYEHDTITFHNFGLKNSDLNKLVLTNNTISQEKIDINRNTLVNFIDYELLANRAHIVISNKIDNLIIWNCISIFKNNLIFLFDTFLNSNFFSFWKFTRYLPSFSIVTDTISSISIFLSFYKFIKVLKIFSQKHFFLNKYIGKNSDTNVNGMQKVKGTYYIEPLIENSKFTEKVDNSQRFNRFYNSLLNYDYKTGNYVGYWEGKYPHLVNVFIEIARGVKKPNWLFSDKYQELMENNFRKFTNSYTGRINLKLSNSDNWYLFHPSPFDSIWNFFFILSKDSEYNTLRWTSFLNLEQKFHSMFFSANTQQKVFANWRQLKFTREAWRCKLLVARHQNSLSKRFTSEESLVYSIERNAKDLLPGWAMITPFSSRTRFTTIGRIDVGLLGVFLAINASIVSSANFLVTYRYLSTLNNRKMRDARSFFSESLIVSSWMMVAANPMLAISILMLLSDRHWQTSFFDYSGGGDTVLFQHMFWFFGHPEVYIILIPIFGFTNTIMSFYFRKRVSARASLMYSMYTIAFLGFFVWGHHMYMVGLSHTTRMLFSTLTVMISVPAATKLMHWCVTIVNSVFVMEIPLIFTFTFAFLFVCGGVSGMCVAHTGMDVLFHDTFYVIGHFHVMFASCAMIGIFAAFYFYFPAIYGVKYSRVYAYIHYVYYVFGQLITIMPMLWLGYCGMPRRVLDYPASLGGWHAISSAGHLLSVLAILSFFIMIYDSIRQGKPAIRNNFGAGRLNTRLSFYLFEANRLSFIQNKSFYTVRFNRLHNNISYPKRDFLLYLTSLDSTLFSYSFFNPSEKTTKHLIWSLYNK